MLGNELNNCWNLKLRPGICLFLLVLGSALCADEASERRLGEEAFAGGDYVNAAKFFDNARVMSGDDEEKWAANTLSLASARLRAGDVKGAQWLLTEFRAKYPARSAGLLPGEVLLSEGRNAEAEQFFSTLAIGAGDPETACAARFGIAYARMRQKNFKSALAEFEQLENENADLPVWARRAHEARIYTLLAAGELDAAESLLAAGKFRDADPMHWKQLELSAVLKRGDLARFGQEWPEAVKSDGTYPNPFLYELATEGAQLAAARKKPKEAALFWSDAFRLGGSDAERQSALRELINLQSVSEPKLAAGSLLRYLEFFPEAPDRTALLLRGARLLVKAGDFKAAAELYFRITGDNKIPEAERLTAAREAAVAAERAGDLKNAEAMLQYLIDQAESPAKQQEGRYLLGEYFFRQKSFRRAADLFKEAAAGTGSYADPARFWLLQSLLELSAYTEAIPVAEKLRDAENENYRTAAEYILALLLEKTGRTEAARSEYEKFLALHPNSEYVPAATLSAAELALALRDYRAAAGGFFRYADLEPKSKAAERALYFALLAGYYGNQPGDVRRALTLFDERYPASVSGVEARLQLAECLRDSGDYAGAEKLLAEVEAGNSGKNADVAAELLLQRARISAGKEDFSEARGLIDQLRKEYPAGPFAADAAFFSGNLESDAGRYAAALADYEEARKLRPEGRFGQLCAGRIADMKYSIYAETLDLADLKAAIALYSELSGDTVEPRLRLESLYKLGKCRELADESDAALEAYNRVLYLAQDQKRQGVAPSPVWCGKAGYAAALAYLKPGTPEGARNALRVIRQLEELKLPTGEDFSRIRQEIGRKFNLQEK